MLSPKATNDAKRNIADLRTDQRSIAFAPLPKQPQLISRPRWKAVAIAHVNVPPRTVDKKVAPEVRIPPSKQHATMISNHGKIAASITPAVRPTISNAYTAAKKS